MGNIGMSELIVILLIVMVLFGGARIPQLMKALGEGIKEFKKATASDAGGEKSKEANDPQKKA